MAKRKKKKHSAAALPAETRAADAMTVAWMLCVVTAILCEIGAIVTRWLLSDYRANVQLQVLFALLAFSALVTGAIGLCLLPIVMKTRRVPPPRAVVVVSVVAGVAPLLLLVAGLGR
jgi:hypothetical protein